MKRYAVITIGLFVVLSIGLSISHAAQYDPVVYQAQKALKVRGYNPGKPDGLWGKSTERAVKYFQVDNELPVTGKLDNQTKNKLGIVSSKRGVRILLKTNYSNQIPQYEGSYALIIGNGNYNNGWQPLPGALRDVKEVSEVLANHGFKIILKTDLTQGDFNKALLEFALAYGNEKKNRLLIYYAGHGHTERMATGDTLGYLVMVDAPKPNIDPLNFRLSSIDMQNLVTQAKLIRSNHVLFLFDSCFSGSILNFRSEIIPESISDNIKYPVRQFITAGRENETVPDYSYFKQAFLDLIEGRDKEPIPDGYITGEELGFFLKNRVPEYNPAQHPQYGKINDPRLNKGDFIFALKAPSQLAASSTAGTEHPSSAIIKDDKGYYYDAIKHMKSLEKNWIQWEKEMGERFAEAVSYDKSSDYTHKEKEAVWKQFLLSYSSNNPNSAMDDKLRGMARKKIEYWQIEHKKDLAYVLWGIRIKDYLFPLNNIPKEFIMSTSVEIVEVKTGSNLSKIGAKKGDEVTCINKIKIRDEKDFIKAYDKYNQEERTVFCIRRKDQVYYVTIYPFKP